MTVSATLARGGHSRVSFFMALKKNHPVECRVKISNGLVSMLK